MECELYIVGNPFFFIVSPLRCPDHPITYLYNTLHYYEDRLRDSPKLKRQLVAAVVGNSVRPKGWALTEEYLATPPEEVTWAPKSSYYVALVKRLVLGEDNTLPSMCNVLRLEL